MKVSFFLMGLFFFLGAMTPAAAQKIVIDGNKLEEIETEYAEIVVSRRAMTQEIQVLIDYGQYIDYHREFNQRIEDERGRLIEFRSIVHALNLMDQNGWEFLHTYSAHTNNYERYHYLFRRKQKKGKG